MVIAVNIENKLSSSSLDSLRICDGDGIQQSIPPTTTIHKHNNKLFTSGRRKLVQYQPKRLSYIKNQHYQHQHKTEKKNKQEEARYCCCAEQRFFLLSSSSSLSTPSKLTKSSPKATISISSNQTIMLPRVIKLSVLLSVALFVLMLVLTYSYHSTAIRLPQAR